METIYKKIRRISLLLGLVVALLPLPVFAQDNSGSIHIEQTDTDTKKPVSGVRLALYQVADTDETGAYRLTVDFQKTGVTADDLCSSEKCSDNVKMLDSYIEKMNPSAKDIRVTDKTGSVDFGSLSDGIYFIKQVNTKEYFEKLGYTYETDSYLVTLPWNNGTLTRTVNCKPKGKITYPGKTSDLTVYKAWKDNNDKAGKRPESISVGLYKNGKLQEKVTLSAANNWTYQWKKLSTGAKWEVKELDVPEGYVSEITSQGNTCTITNKWTPTTPGSPGNPDSPGSSKTSAKKSTSVKTGDTTNVAVYVVLFAGAVIVVTGIWFYRKKRKQIRKK